MTILGVDFGGQPTDPAATKVGFGEADRVMATLLVGRHIPPPDT
ncbi:MAG: hypothetical protein V3S60_10340 [Acidimicrobiia bacterium]